MTRKPSGTFETRTALSDFPPKLVFFKRSDFVTAQMPPSNERWDDFSTCTYFLMDAQESPHVPDKIRKHEVRLMFPRLGCKAIDVAFALASGRKRGRPRGN